MRAFRTLSSLALAAILLPAAVQAGAPYFDTGVLISTTEPYAVAQDVGEVYADRAVYGKLEGRTPADAYSFTPSRDGEQTLSLTGPARSDAPPYLVLLDATEGTAPEQIGVPLPGEGYHAALIKEAPAGTVSTEPALLRSGTVFARQRVKLTGGKKYYLLVLDSERTGGSYAVRFGDGKAWSAKDVFSHFGGWFRVETSAYGASSPFVFGPKTLGMAVFLLGFAALFGIWLAEEIFSWLANRVKSAAFALVRLQPVSKVFSLLALWFFALGGYLYFGQASWDGLSPLLLLPALGVLIVTLLRASSAGPRLAVLEVAKNEATIPLALRRSLFVLSLTGILSYGGFLLLLAVYLANRA